MKRSPLRLVALADIHGTLAFLPAVEDVLRQADAVIIAGDITDFGGSEMVASVIEAIASINPHIAAVHGNCDRPQVQTYLAEQGVGVHGQAKKIGDLICVGVGGALVCSGRTPNEVDDEAFAAAIDLLGQDPSAGPQPLVLVTHQPAYGTRLDTVPGNGHAGSRAIRAFIERYRPILAVSGHFHEVIGVDQIGPTTLVNPGPFKAGRYATVEIEVGKAVVEFKTV